MKNIYEDGNDRNNMEEIGSGSAPLSEEATAKPDHLPPQSSDSLFEKPAENRQAAAAGTAMPNLTPEQIAALFGQFLSQFSANIQPPQPAQPQTVPAPTPDVKPPEPNDTGKRILFQSEDFDENPTRESDEPLMLSEADLDEERKKSFYDDDELFDLVGQTAPSSASTVKMTDFGDSFSIAEVDIDSEDLPSLPEHAPSVPKIQAPPVVRAGTQTARPQASRTPTGKAYAPPIQPTGTKKTVPNPIYPIQPQVVKPAYTPPISSSPYNAGSFTATDVEEEPPKAPKKRKPSDIIRIVVLSVSIVAIIVASGVLIREYKLHKDNEKLEAEISNLIIDDVTTTTEKQTTTKKSNNTQKTTKPQKTTAPTTTAAPTPEQQWAQIKAQYPNVIFPPNLQLKYAKLYATNQEFVGYLSAEGVGLNLPIVQTTDDEKYLSKNFYGQNTKYGCPFVTHFNNIETLDTNTVIFGHHMNDKTVFGALDHYKTIEGFKKAPVITFNTLYQDYKWKVIAAFITNAYEEDDNGYVFRYYFTSLSTEERYAAYLNELAQRSLYDTGVDVLPSDKILTLSTCSHEFNEARFVVVARLVRPGESETVDVSRAVVNSNPRYPQAYYDKKKQKNPYANASQWQVG